MNRRIFSTKRNQEAIQNKRQRTNQQAPPQKWFLQNLASEVCKCTFHITLFSFLLNFFFFFWFCFVCLFVFVFVCVCVFFYFYYYFFFVRVSGGSRIYFWGFSKKLHFGLRSESCGLCNFFITKFFIVHISKRIKDEEYYIYNIFTTLFQKIIGYKLLLVII